jgi:inner membrane protein
VAVGSLLPDVDVIGFRFGIRYADFWGHCGFTHSLLFATLLAALIVGIGFRRGVLGMQPPLVWAYLFLVTASHGLLDAMTDGGLGVAFLSPFDNHRFFLPWTPIRVSPIGVGRFFTSRGLVVLKSEVLWVWLPVILLMTVAQLVRQQNKPSSE